MRRGRSGSIGLAVLAVLSFAATPHAFAQNLRESPLGAESASLGQTGVAASREEGSALYNPAAFATASGDSLSLSTMVFTTAAIPVQPKEPVSGQVARQTNSSGGVTYFPSSIAYARAFTSEALRLGFAISVLVPTFESYGRIRRNQHGAGTLLSVENDENELRMKRLYVGPSFAVGVGAVRFGGSLFFSVTEIEDVQVFADTNATVDGITDANQFQFVRELQLFGLAGVAGVQADLSDDLTLGVSARTGLGTFAGRGLEQDVLRSVSSAASVSARVGSVGSDLGYPDPLQLRGGLKLKLEALTLRADVLVTLFAGDPVLGNYTTSITNFSGGQPISPNAGRTQRRLSAKSTVNGSFGAQIKLVEALFLNVGFLTDFSSAGPKKDEMPPDGDDPRIVFERFEGFDRFWTTIGASWISGIVSAHVGVAGGVVSYRSVDLWPTRGSDDRQIGYALRVFFSGGVSAEKLLGML